MSVLSNMPDYLKQHLQTRYMGRCLHYLESTTTTMDVARDLALKGAAEGLAVIAGTQQSGRGRLGRTWFSPEGSLAISIILKPDLNRIYLLPAISSLAVLCALRRLGVSAVIKWPNDVLIKGKKVCGILIENQGEASHLLYSIVGIGINVDFNLEQYPDIAELATCVSAHLSHNVSVPEVALHLLTELESIYSETDIKKIMNEWKDNMETIGRWVRVNMGNRIEEGKAVSIDEAGNLILHRKDNSLLSVVAGDVTLLKD